MKKTVSQENTFCALQGAAAESSSMVTVPRGVLDSVLALLKPYCPNLSVQQAEENSLSPAMRGPRLLTRQEAADMLSVSLNTINRYLNTGKLRRVILSNHAVRVDYKSVEELLAN